MANRVAEVATQLFRQPASDKDSQANTIARLFIMKCQARWKEVHAVEMSGPDGPAATGPPPITIVLPDDGRQSLDFMRKSGGIGGARWPSTRCALIEAEPEMVASQ